MRGPHNYSQQDYLDVLKTDKVWSTREPKTIGIVGAGISGLLAAWLLQRAGHVVKVLEASKTVGGRIKTLREGFSGGLYAEAGAMRIPESHKLTLHLIYDLFGLKTQPFVNICKNSLLMINNQQVTRGEYEADPSKLKFETEAHEEGLTANQIFDQTLTTYIRRLRGFKQFQIKDFSRDHTQQDRDLQRQLTEELDKHSLRTFLVEVARIKNKKLSAGAIEMVCTVMASEMQMPVSLAEVFHEHSELHGDEETVSIVGGMDMLPKIIRRLGEWLAKAQTNA